MSPPAAYSWVIASRPGSGAVSAKELLSKLRDFQEPGGTLQAFDLRSVASPRHLESALLHAQRALASGEARLRDPGAVLALYLAGADQLERALRRVGVGEDTVQILLVAQPQRDLRPIASSLGWPLSTQVLPAHPTRECLQRLELDPDLWQSGPETRWESAVLEHVAMVDFRH